MDPTLIYALSHATPAVLAVVACWWLAKENRRKDEDLRKMVDRYVSKFEKLAEMQQETLRMQGQATLAVREAANAISELRQELDEEK